MRRALRVLISTGTAWVGIALMLTGLLGGCKDDDHDDDVDAGFVTSLAPLEGGKASSTFKVTSLNVGLRLTVENPSSHTKHIYWPTEQRYDFTVHGGGGLVWNWANGRTFQDNEGMTTVFPHQTLTYNQSWDMRNNAGSIVSPGTYTVGGTITNSLFLGEDVPEPPAVTITIEP